MTNHCATCKWYRPRQRWESEDPGPETGHCLLGSSSHGKPDESKALAWAEDMEDYRAEMAVKPEFGCVQWTKKENDEA